MTSDVEKPLTAVASVFSYSSAATKLSDPHSCFCEVTTSKSLALLPRFLSNIKNGITDHFDRELNVFSEKLNGVLIAYKNIRLKNYCGTVIGDDPLIYADIVADLIIFRPEPGCTLEGVVNKIGRDHIGYLVHGCFNASTEKPPDLKNDALNVGDTVLLDVALLLPVNGILAICATINEESLEGLKANLSAKKKKMPVKMDITNNKGRKSSGSDASGTGTESTSFQRQSRLDLWMTPKKRKAIDDGETADDMHPAKKFKIVSPGSKTKVASPVKKSNVVDIDVEDVEGVEAGDSDLNVTFDTQLVQKADEAILSEKKRLKQERKARKRELKEAAKRELNASKTKLDSLSGNEPAESDTYLTADSQVYLTPGEVESEKKILKRERREKKRQEKANVACVDITGVEDTDFDLDETTDSLLIKTADETMTKKLRLKQEKKARKKKLEQENTKVLAVDTENVSKIEIASPLVSQTADDAVSEKRRLKQEKKARQKQKRKEKKELKRAEEEKGLGIIGSFAEPEKLVPKSVSADVVSKVSKTVIEKKIHVISDSDSSSDFEFVGNPLLKTDKPAQKHLPGLSPDRLASVTGSVMPNQQTSPSVVLDSVRKSKKKKRDKSECEHKKTHVKNKSDNVVVNSPLAFTKVKDKKKEKTKVDNVLNMSKVPDMPELTLSSKKHKKKHKESVLVESSAGVELNASIKLRSKDLLHDSPVVGSKKKKFDIGASASPIPVHVLESTMIHPSKECHRKSDLFISPIASESASPGSCKKQKMQTAVIESASPVHSKSKKKSVSVASISQTDVSGLDTSSVEKKKHKKKKKSKDKDRPSFDLNVTGSGVSGREISKESVSLASIAPTDISGLDALSVEKKKHKKKRKSKDKNRPSSDLNVTGSGVSGREILKEFVSVDSIAPTDISGLDALSVEKKKHKKKKKSKDKDRPSVDLNMTGESVQDSGSKKKKDAMSSAAGCDSDVSKMSESKSGTIFNYFAPCPMGERLPRKRNNSAVSMNNELEVSTESKKKQKKSKEKGSDLVVDGPQTVPVSSKKLKRDASRSGTDSAGPRKRSKKSKDSLEVVVIPDSRRSLQNEFLEKVSKSSKKKHCIDEDDSGVNSLASSVLSISNRGVGATGASVDASLVRSSLEFEISMKKKKKKKKEY